MRIDAELLLLCKQVVAASMVFVLDSNGLRAKVWQICFRLGSAFPGPWPQLRLVLPFCGSGAATQIR